MLSYPGAQAIDPHERKTLQRLIAALCDLAQLELDRSYKSAEVIRDLLATLRITHSQPRPPRLAAGGRRNQSR